MADETTMVTTMPTLVFGSVLGAALSALLGRPAFTAGLLLVAKFFLQAVFARRLNAYSQGADPVAIGARSLNGLAAILPIAIRLRALFRGGI